MQGSNCQPNRLIHEPSPYLQQHAYNPVDWYPWGEEAIRRARAEDRPILLSIGYAACHWCHVMERECFQDPAIAEQMNRWFVNVKVDREERPDLDQVYQTAAQVLGSGGGWPLTVFLTPDLKPFFAGTYFPPTDRRGLPGFPRVLEAVAKAYRERREEVERAAERVADVLRRASRMTTPEGAASPTGRGGRDGAAASAPVDLADQNGAALKGGRPAAVRWLLSAAERIGRSYDPEFGGFGRAPKFPHTSALAVLLRAAGTALSRGMNRSRGSGTGTDGTPRAGNGDDGGGPGAVADGAARVAENWPAGGRAGAGADPGEAASGAPATFREMALHTLQAMAMGGLFDHLAGGFHRYATDRAWLIPHFEKMLYDQALLVPLYLDAYRLTGDPFYARVARHTLDFVLEEMTTPEGAFASTLDADSDGREGAYYVWTPAQLRQALGDDDAALAARWFGVTPEGNFEDGTTVLYRAVAEEDVPRLAQELGLSAAALRERLESIRRRLLAARRRRTPPCRDDKILTGWNGMMVAALARGGLVLDEGRYCEAARRAVDFLLDQMKGPDGRLLHAYRRRPLDVPGFLEDYAFLMDGLLELHAVDGDGRWLEEADRLARPLIDGFWDREAGVFFNAPEDAGTPLVRPVELFDQGLPSANAVAASALARLAAITGDGQYQQVVDRFLDATGALAEEQPLAMASTVLLVADQRAGYTEVVLVGERDDPELSQWRRRLGALYLPELLLTCRPLRAEIARRVLWEGREAVEGRPTAYVCRQFTCSLPQTDWEGLRRELGV